MSDDIPLIFAEELRAGAPKAVPVAMFLSAATAAQMQQYATAGWRVLVPSDFKSTAKIDLTSIPAATATDGGCALLSCEAPHLRADTATRIQQWRPDVVKINCAFHDVADAAALAPALVSAGYIALAAQWRDDNSFSLRSLERIAPLAEIRPPDWDRISLIGVREPNHARIILALARLYAGEEQRIAELRVANMIRNDHITRLEDALVEKQPSDAFKLQRS